MLFFFFFLLKKMSNVKCRKFYSFLAFFPPATKKNAKNWAQRVGLGGKSQSTYLWARVCETNLFFYPWSNMCIFNTIFQYFLIISDILCATVKAYLLIVRSDLLLLLLKLLLYLIALQKNTRNKKKT